MTNWLQKTAPKSLIDEIKGYGGWTEEQMRHDGVVIWQKDDDFFVSLGDWAKCDADDIRGAIERLYPKAKVEWDFEAGPSCHSADNSDGEDWTKVF